MIRGGRAEGSGTEAAEVSIDASHRAAVYAAPAPGGALHRLASLWLGRDAATGRPTRPADPARDALVAEPARYGFHATLRAPFRPREGVTLDALSDRVAALAAGRAAPVIRRLALARLGDFFALAPAEPEPAIGTLEGEVLDAFEPCRAPLSPDEVARRRPERLSPRQRALLDLYGYPFVRDEFRFHMTLTGPVPGPAEAVRRALESHFAGALDRPWAVEGLALFVEPERGAPFRIHGFHPFGPAAAIQPREPREPREPRDPRDGA